jgi:hypothetical protein
VGCRGILLVSVGVAAEVDAPHCAYDVAGPHADPKLGIRDAETQELVGGGGVAEGTDDGRCGAHPLRVRGGRAPLGAPVPVQVPVQVPLPVPGVPPAPERSVGESRDTPHPRAATAARCEKLRAARPGRPGAAEAAATMTATDAARRQTRGQPPANPGQSLGTAPSPHHPTTAPPPDPPAPPPTLPGPHCRRRRLRLTPWLPPCIAVTGQRLLPK